MTQILIKVIGNYQYQTAHCLGEGVYGKVYQGIERQTKQKVAIKKIDLISLANDKYLQNAIFSEIYLLKRFDHPNIVKFKDVLSSKNSLYIITQYCRGGDLRDQIRKRRFNEDEVYQVLTQIANGFKELVAKKVVHRDLKPANILIHEGTYKIADFGFAKYVDNFGNQMLKSCVGSPIYMAPQLLEREPYTTKCDVWSLGVITYEMIYGLSPWRAKDQNQLIHGLKTIPINSILKSSKFLSPKMSDFIAKCLVYNQKQRYSWEDIFKLLLPTQLYQQPSLSHNYSSSSASSPNKSHVRIYNPKLRATQPLELNYHSQSNPNMNNGKNGSLYQRQRQRQRERQREKQKQKSRQDTRVLRRQNRSKSPNIGLMQFRQQTSDRPSFNHAYTPRQHNSSLNQLLPSSTPRQTNSNLYVPLNNIQIPSSPISNPAMVVSPRPPLTNQSPRKSYMQNQLKRKLSQSDHSKQYKLYNECQYRYFCCTQLFIIFQQLELTASAPYAYSRLLYILIQFIKKQNNYIRSQLLVAPYSKITQQLLIKIQIEQKLTQMLQKSIITLMQQYHYYQRIQNEIRSQMSYMLSQLMNQEKLQKISQTLYQGLKQNALIFIDLKNKNKNNNSEQSDLVIEVLWYISDLLVMHKNKTDPLSEVSQKTEEDRNDVIALEMKIHRFIA